MFAKISKKIKKIDQFELAKIMLILVIVTALGLNMAFPQPVETQSKENIAKITTNFINEHFIINESYPENIEREPVQVLWVVATAYSSTPDQTDSTPCITANGHDLCEQYEKTGSGNTIAANFLRMNTTVRMPDEFGRKVFEVRDRMNSRYGYGRIDIWMPTRAEARDFGVKLVKLEIY